MPIRRPDSQPHTLPIAAAPGFEHLSASVLETLAKLVAGRVDFVLLGETARPLRIVPAPYARNLERLARVREALGEGQSVLAVITPLSLRYQELLYESFPREIAAGIRVEVLPEAVVASISVGRGEIRAGRSAPTAA